MNTIILYTLYILTRVPCATTRWLWSPRQRTIAQTCNAPTEHRSAYVIKRMLPETLLIEQLVDAFWGFVTTENTRI